MLALVEQYARGITIDTSALEEAVGRIDPSNLSELSSTLEGNLFAPQQTPEQKAVLQRLETMLALVEGWVDEVVGQATAQRMPAGGCAGRDRTPGPGHRRAGRGHVRHPGRARAAAAPDAGRRQPVGRGARRPGPEGRDAVWSHPDLVPTSADLDDPLGFAAAEPVEKADDDDFDAALAELLDAEQARRRGPAA